MIILNEREYAENCLRNGLMDSKPFNTLSILAKYYYHCFGYRKKKITSLLLDYLSKYYPRYELNELSWQTSVEKIASNAGSFELFEISGVKVTKSEMETILGLKNKVLERLAFTMLCLAKLNNIKNPRNNGWVNSDSKEIFSYARISCKADEREVKIGQLWQKGLLEFSKRNDNLNCRVTFIDDNSDEELFMSEISFQELGYEYMNYTNKLPKGKFFIRCLECGCLTYGNKNKSKKYCSKCKKNTPQVSKTVICVDCGKRFETSSKNSKSIRCRECQNIINREKKRLWKQQNRQK